MGCLLFFFFFFCFLEVRSANLFRLCRALCRAVWGFDSQARADSSILNTRKRSPIALVFTSISAASPPPPPSPQPTTNTATIGHSYHYNYYCCWYHCYCYYYYNYCCCCHFVLCSKVGYQSCAVWQTEAAILVLTPGDDHSYY